MNINIIPLYFPKRLLKDRVSTSSLAEIRETCLWCLNSPRDSSEIYWWCMNSKIEIYLTYDQ